MTGKAQSLHMLELNAGAALRVKSKSYMIGDRGSRRLQVDRGGRAGRIDEYTLSTSPLS